MITIPFKIGDTFTLSCVYNVDGVPAALPAGVRSQLRSGNGTLVEELVFTAVNANVGQYTLSAPASSTAAWKTGVLYGDIQYTDAGGNVASTESYAVSVLADITHD